MLWKVVFFNNFALEVTLSRNHFTRAVQPTVYILGLGFVGDISSSYDGVSRMERWEEEMSAATEIWGH